MRRLRIRKYQHSWLIFTDEWYLNFEDGKVYTEKTPPQWFDWDFWAGLDWDEVFSDDDEGDSR